MFSARFLFSLLLILSFASSSFASATRTRSIASVSSRFDSADRESDLINEIDRQADVAFENFLTASGSRVPLSTLMRAQREAVFRLKQMHALTDVLKAAGPAPATAIVATEILTNFVLAPIATAMGRPEVAGVMIVAPWGLVTGFGVFSFQLMKERYQIARSLGRYSLRSLDRVRDLVVGYDLKYHVSSVIYQSMEADLGTVEFEVLRKGWAFDEAKMPSVLISELEDLVRQSSDGAWYLQAIYMEKLDPGFYSALLLRFINQREPLTEQLVSLVRARLPLVESSNDPLALRDHLIGIADVRMQIDREVRASQKTKLLLKKRRRAEKLTTLEEKNLQTQLDLELNRLQDVRERLLHHEYSVLLEAQGLMANGGPLASAKVSGVRAEALISLALEARNIPLVKSETAAPKPPRPSVVERVRAAVLPARALVCRDLFI